jgi:hypothetical protein
MLVLLLVWVAEKYWLVENLNLMEMLLVMFEVSDNNHPLLLLKIVPIDAEMLQQME